MPIAGVYWQTSLPLHQALDLISPILGALAVLPLLFFCFLLVVGLFGAQLTGWSKPPGPGFYPASSAPFSPRLFLIQVLPLLKIW